MRKEVIAKKINKNIAFQKNLPFHKAVYDKRA